jgi:predicted MarR family transcription regulator
VSSNYKNKKFFNISVQLECMSSTITVELSQGEIDILEDIGKRKGITSIADVIKFLIHDNDPDAYAC